MMDALKILLFCSLVYLVGAAAYEFHQGLPKDDLIHYFGTALEREVPPYEIVSPERVEDVRQKRTTNRRTEVIQYHLSAFGEDYQLELRPNFKLLSHGCVVHKINNMINDVLPCISRQCFYFGTALKDNTSRVAVSTCNGLHGVISVSGEELFVQPLRDNHIQLVKTETKLENPHLVYKRTTNIQLNDREDYSSTLTNTLLRRARRSRTKKYIELLAVVDPEMAKFHGDDIQRFTLTSLNIAASRLADPSIGVQLELTVVQITILEEHPVGLTITNDATSTLSSFCRWQENRIRVGERLRNHFDIAALLVRKNLQEKGNFATTGLAYVGGTCSPGQRCMVCEDNGMNIGFIIAHEMGHTLGMNHDGEENSCQDGINVMSSSGGKGTSGYKWSACSRESISDFLSQRKASCLNNAPLVKRKVHDDNLKPGLVYSADRQCQFSYGEGSVHCPEGEALWKSYGDDMCARLTCHNPNKPGYCAAGSTPMMDGTECASSSWCIEGRCVPYDSDAPESIDGGWTNWDSDWSECSRTCGGGTRQKRRSCTDPSPQFGGEDCQGESLIAELCNMADCNVTQEAFREEQCSSTDSTPLHGANHHWTPVNILSGDEQCAMFCSMDDTMVTLMRSDHYRDGTHCSGAGSYNKCLDGKCREFGCDGKLESGRIYDICGECSGHNSTCKVIKGTFNHGTPKAVVLNNDRLFPRNSQKASYRQYNAPGLSIHYYGRPETIEIAGPLPDTVELQVFRLYSDEYEGTEPDIKYEYSIIPFRDIKRAFSWVANFGPCSVSCGGGVSTRSITCKDINSEQEVEDYLCNLREKPSTGNKRCNEHACPPSWRTNDYSVCSRTCDGGIKTRLVECVQFENGAETIIEPENCDKPKPSAFISCNEQPCPTHWNVGEWSMCSVTCAKGIRSRDVSCMTHDEKTEVDDSQCTSEKPGTTASCNAGPCFPNIVGTDCKDATDCLDYGESVCYGEYKEWAKQNCMKFCGFCIADPSGSPQTQQQACEDTTDCHSYGQNVCTQYKEWSELNCRKFCGLCKLDDSSRGTSSTKRKTSSILPTSVSMSPATETTATTNGGTGTCSDTIDNCNAYGKTVCTQYQEWAHQNCQKYCEICASEQRITSERTTTTVSLRTTVIHGVGCKDTLGDCIAYGGNMCTNYREWAEQNCMKYCGFCVEDLDTTPQLSTTLSSSDMLTTEMENAEQCVDTKSNCRAYGSSVCTEYKEWAQINCKRHCGFCKQDGCTDKIVDCSVYGSNVCTNYKDWAKLNCQRFCKFCNPL